MCKRSKRLEHFIVYYINVILRPNGIRQNYRMKNLKKKLDFITKNKENFFLKITY